MISQDKIWLGTSSEGPVCLLKQMANRHGLISGATGTGKTVTLQVLAEGFSKLGVPVFLADIKGDLGGLSVPAEVNEKIQKRLEQTGATDFSPKANPVVFWDVFGEKGHPVRTTVSEMGPLLLGRMLDLNDTQTGVLHLVFRIADDEGMLLIDLKDLRAMLTYCGENAQQYTLRYGNISKATVGAIQRAIAILEEQGGNAFFGEPALHISDWLRQDEAGKGLINILSAEYLFLRPNLYSAFLLWMLGELYEALPEQGDQGPLRMAFFFDEAHLLFKDCSKTLLDKIELTIRLIRSKGIGVFFITQNPADVPSSVLSQLSGRVQHALRAFTPVEQRVVKAVAATFRVNPAFDTEEAILSLGTGEALVSFLDEEGSPGVTQKVIVLPPESRIGTISDALRSEIINTSDLYGKYDEAVDRVSAYEILSAKFFGHGVQATSVLTQEEPEQAPEQEPAAPVMAKTAFKVFDPQTGTYVTQESYVPSVQPYQQQTVYAPQPQVQPATIQQAQPQNPPVLIYNPQTGQYEPQQLTNMAQDAAPKKQAKKQKTEKKEKTLAERMVENVAKSTASGAGYTIGRTLSRNILGVFGIK